MLFILHSDNLLMCLKIKFENIKLTRFFPKESDMLKTLICFEFVLCTMHVKFLNSLELASCLQGL